MKEVRCRVTEEVETRRITRLTVSMKQLVQMILEQTDADKDASFWVQDDLLTITFTRTGSGIVREFELLADSVRLVSESCNEDQTVSFS